jgi:hypothetical protein
MEIEKKRTDLLNHLATKYNLKRYLEIGVQNPIQNFDKIVCEYKVSVDPDPKAHATFCKTSDEFFEIISGMAEQYQVPRNDGGNDTHYKTVDLIFIDGLHTAEQVKKDFENALKVLSPNGFIVLHDCNPLKEEHTIVPRPTERGHWNGDVYKFAASLLTSGNSWTIDIDNGCLVWQNKTGGQYASLNKSITWDYFDKNRKELLNLISWDEFVRL